MAVDYVAKYTLKFNNLASRGLLKAGKLADKVGKSLKKVTLAGLAGGGVLGVAMDRVNASLAEQVRLAKSVGSTHTDLQPLANVARSLGMEFDNVVDLQEELANKVGEFKNLGELISLEEGLHGLNLQAKEFVKLNPADQMKALLIASSKVDQQIAASSADMILGGEASKIFGALNDQVRRSGKTVHEFLAIQSRLNVLTDKGRDGAIRYNDAMRQLSIFTGSVVSEAFGRLGGIIAPLIERFAEFISVNKDLIGTKLDEFMKRISVRLAALDFNAIASRAKIFKNQVSDIVSRISEFVEKRGGIQSVFKAMKLLFGLFILGKLASIIMGVATAVGVLGVALKVVGLTLAANPIILIMMAIGFFAAAAVIQIRKHWDTIGPIFNRAKDAVANAYQVSKPYLEAFAKLSAMAFGKIKGDVNKVVEILSVVWAAVWPVASQVVKVHINVIKAAIGLLGKIFSTAVEFGKGFGKGMGSVWSSIKDGALGMVNIVKGKIDKLLSWLESVKNKAANIRDSILAGLGNDAAQDRIDARARQARQTALASSGGQDRALTRIEDTFVGAPSENKTDVHLKVNVDKDGVSVQRRDGDTGVTSNLPSQPHNGNTGIL